MFQKMLVANDGSPCGERALKEALELAKRLGLGLAMICVEELPRFPASIDEVEEAQADAEGIFDEIVATARALARSHGVAFEAHVIAGHPVPSIVDFVKNRGYDLLIVGFMGHTALYNRLIGSTTDRLVEHAPCRVMVVK
jgi:nucleotide-binding universal stress UspA family protein